MSEINRIHIMIIVIAFTGSLSSINLYTHTQEIKKLKQEIKLLQKAELSSKKPTLK